MTHVGFVVTSSLLFVLLSCSPATARITDWIGWLEQLSGPGPFLDDDSWKPAGFTLTACRTDDVHKGPDSNVRLQKFVLGTPPRQAQKGCLYGDYQLFVAPAEEFKVDGTDTQFVTGRGFPRITARMFEVGLSYAIAPMVDVGAGGGVIWFGAQDAQKNPYKLTLTPIRIAFKPAMVIPQARRFKWAGGLKLVLKETYIRGGLSGADFGATGPTPATAYRNNGELARSVSLNVDLTEIICAPAGLQADFSWTRFLGDCEGPRPDTITVFVRTDDINKTPIHDATVCFFPSVGSVFPAKTSGNGTANLPVAGRVITVVSGGTTIPLTSREPQMNDSVIVVSHPEYQQATFLVASETRRLDVRLKLAREPQQVVPCSSITVQ